MTNVSKRQLPEKDMQLLFSQLSDIIGKLDEGDANNFLRDLLGTKERIMLAKRFAVIIMLTESYSGYQISKKLKVSSATVENTRKKLDNGKYDRILTQLCTNKKAYLSFWEVLDKALHLGGVLPHYNGLDRYKHIRRQ